LKEELVFRDKVVLAVRNVVSLAPKLGLMKKPRYHKDGVTFLVAVKDEERWIKPCIQSIQDVADEIIIVDSSVEDTTTKIVESLAANNTKIKHIKFYYGGFNAFALALHIGLVGASYKWVFKWDSDLIAKSPEAIKEWINRLKHLDKNRYYVIDVPRINLEGDLEHQSRSEPFGAYEGRLFTWSPELRWLVKDNYYEQISGDSIWGHRFPPYYNNLRWHEPYVFHCNIKSPKRTLTRKYWHDYMAQKENRFASLDEYAAYRIRQDEGISVEEGIKKAMDQITEGIMPYDKVRFGELPELLKYSQNAI
jgi:glycosyltransferase involved in cell wall biosynthesis